MKDFTQRTIGSLIAITAVACLLIFAFHPWFRFVVASVVALLTCVAIWEYEQLAQAKGARTLYPVLMFLGIAQVFSFFIPAMESSRGFYPLLIFFIEFLILVALHFKEKEGAIVDLAVSLFSLVYIAVPMGMVLGILYGISGQDGRWWVAYLLVVTKVSDMGAYFGGSLWGRRKLALAISPGKTIEGAIVGLVCALAVSFVFYWIGHFEGSSFELRMFEWFWLGIVLACVGQFGDLSESLLKRDANKKDSNNLPGLGGVLDLIDSLLFNALIIYFYLNYLRI